MRPTIIRKMIFTAKQRLMPTLSGDEAQNILRRHVDSGRPFMAGRFGSVEIKALLYKTLPSPISKMLLKAYTYRHFGNNAVFFPVNEAMLQRYADLMMADMPEIDVLGSWRPEEIFLKKHLKQAVRIKLGDLGPILSDKLWAQSLKGKKVLVIHPFAKSIMHQYTNNRDKIFGDLSDIILPEFAQIQVIQAVQTIAGNKSEFSTWFEALDHMKKQIDQADFDIALIGCGAYGLHLAAHCKRIGKQAVHIGGPLQLYFGIKGKRWANMNLYNEYWIRPDASEIPRNIDKVEGGCYW